MDLAEGAKLDFLIQEQGVDFQVASVEILYLDLNL